MASVAHFVCGSEYPISGCGIEVFLRLGHFVRGFRLPIESLFWTFRSEMVVDLRLFG